MTSISGVITCEIAPDGGLYGRYPDGVLPDELSVLTFDGLADGSDIPSPLVELAGTFEIRNERLSMTGSIEPNTVGSYVGMDTGTTDGNISATFYPNGGTGDETGLMVRYVDNDNFWDCININGTVALVVVVDNVIAQSPADYAVPNYDPNAPLYLRINMLGDVFSVFVNNVFAFSVTDARHNTATIHGAKFAGGQMEMDDLLLPNAIPAPLTANRFYVPGHSLFNHDNSGNLPDVGPSTPYTRTGSWINHFAAANGDDSYGFGNFGQIVTQNAGWIAAGDPPPIQFDFAENGIADAVSPFADNDWTHFYFMAANFEQVETPPADYVAQTLTLLDELYSYNPNAYMMMYVHWAEPFLAGSFVDDANLTTAEYQVYRDFNRGPVYFDWHVDWYNLVRAQRPHYRLRFIPVEAIIADCIDNLSGLQSTTFTEMYGDSAPHGKDPCYFLAGLICYMCGFRKKPDVSNFSLPVDATQLTPRFFGNVELIADYVWERILHYNETYEVL